MVTNYRGYKAGDRVRRVVASPEYGKKGEVGIVESVASLGVFVEGHRYWGNSAIERYEIQVGDHVRGKRTKQDFGEVLDIGTFEYGPFGRKAYLSNGQGVFLSALEPVPEKSEREKLIEEFVKKHVSGDEEKAKTCLVDFAEAYAKLI